MSFKNQVYFSIGEQKVNIFSENLNLLMDAEQQEEANDTNPLLFPSRPRTGMHTKGEGERRIRKGEG